jgi:hypothetical protein
MSSSSVLHGTGVLLDGSVCEPLWRIIQTELNRRRGDGGMVRPEIALAVEALRQAASEYLSMSAAGHVSRTSADLPAVSNHEAGQRDLTTQQLADLPHIGARHARRVATTYGITPVGTPPYRWSRIDATALLESRRTA